MAARTHRPTHTTARASRYAVALSSFSPSYLFPPPPLLKLPLFIPFLSSHYLAYVTPLSHFLLSSSTRYTRATFSLGVLESSSDSSRSSSPCGVWVHRSLNEGSTYRSTLRAQCLILDYLIS